MYLNTYDWLCHYLCFLDLQYVTASVATNTWGPAKNIHVRSALDTHCACAAYATGARRVAFAAISTKLSECPLPTRFSYCDLFTLSALMVYRSKNDIALGNSRRKTLIIRFTVIVASFSLASQLAD